MKRSIVWLASYPKSGNTWMRVFLANYLANADTPLSINQMQHFGLGDSIPRMYRMVAGRDVDTSDRNITLGLRNRVLQGIVANNADVNFVKTHNIRGEAFGIDLIPQAYTRQAIYIMRNPLDMLVSYARHYGMTHAEAAEALGRSDHGTSADPGTVCQFLGSWSDHVKSWTRGAKFPVLPMRYEDLLEDPMTHFGRVIEAIGIPKDEDRLQRAIKFSSFDELRGQEDKEGFAEQSSHSERFFHSGQTGQWKETLDAGIISKIRRDHKRLMKEYGYYSV